MPAAPPAHHQQQVGQQARELKEDQEFGSFEPSLRSHGSAAGTTATRGRESGAGTAAAASQSAAGEALASGQQAPASSAPCPASLQAAPAVPAALNATRLSPSTPGRLSSSGREQPGGKDPGTPRRIKKGLLSAFNRFLRL